MAILNLLIGTHFFFQKIRTKRHVFIEWISCVTLNFSFRQLQVMPYVAQMKIWRQIFLTEDVRFWYLLNRPLLRTQVLPQNKLYGLQDVYQPLIPVILLLIPKICSRKLVLTELEIDMLIQQCLEEQACLYVGCLWQFQHFQLILCHNLYVYLMIILSMKRQISQTCLVDSNSNFAIQAWLKFNSYHFFFMLEKLCMHFFVARQ